mmetsp:Transcript_41873/g.76082  ORF Transcript_41873/g.76082 Transcript_41873/m.76082 type:complete len:294 (-) Transcript_41873:209-1090(-)
MCRFALLALIPKLAAASGHNVCPETASSALLQIQAARPLKVHINESLETDMIHRVDEDALFTSAKDNAYSVVPLHDNSSTSVLDAPESLVAVDSNTTLGKDMPTSRLSNATLGPWAKAQSILLPGHKNISLLATAARVALNPADMVLETAGHALGAVTGQFQREIEMNITTTEAETRSKIVLALINAFALGMCGIDRCYMGQLLLGTLKFVTLGGLGVWMLIDNIVIFMNCLLRSPSLNVLGYHADFDEWEVGVAFWISITAALLYVWSCCSTIYDTAVRSKDSVDKFDEDLP